MYVYSMAGRNTICLLIVIIHDINMYDIYYVARPAEAAGARGAALRELYQTQSLQTTVLYCTIL